MPKPKQFLTDLEIEESAAMVLDAHVHGGRENPSLPIDVDTLTECDFGFNISWCNLLDPPGCRTFGSLIPTPGDAHPARLVLNSRYEDFLNSHPGIERLTRGHELGHWVVHIDEGKLKTGVLPFEEENADLRFHRMQDTDRTLAADLRNRLAKFATTDERAYRLLKPRQQNPDAWIEPDWMHRQAEHFSACLLVPRQPLLRLLEDGSDASSYGTHSRLAEKFVVSKRVIQIRLLKLRLIEEREPGRYQNVTSRTKRLF